MSGQDYIGSKISLISLSDIRYVGILHSINTNDSTVSLENVRSFGTEGRRGNPDDEVVPSDTVFDFVVFRGSDIKDLQVFEAPVKPVAPPPPPPSSRPQGMMDPSHRQSMEGYPPPPPMNPYMMPSYPPQTHQAMYWQSPMYSGQQQQQQQQQQQPMGQSPMGQSPMGQSPMQPAPVSQPKQQQPATTLQPATIPQAPVPARDMTTQEQPLTSTKQLDQQEIDGATVENLAKQVSELDVDSKDATQPSLATSSPPLPTTTQPQQPQQQRQSNYRNVRQNNNNNYRQNNNNNYGNASRGQTGKQRINIPQSDFDFESSNAKFSKNDLLKELFDGDTDERKDEQHNIPQQQQYAQEEEEVVIPPANDDGFYNKSKSFFDNISCESKERQDQEGLSIDRRGKYQEERKLNVETFGQASVDQSRYRNFRGRGGYRGGYRGNRGGGGGYYRGGNRNNNNNRGNYSGHRPQPQQQSELQQQ